MTDLELVQARVDEDPLYLVPHVGTVVNLHEPNEVARALADVRELKRQLDEVRALLEGALRLESIRLGTKTLHLDGVDAVIAGGPAYEYDAELLMSRLRAAGCPEHRITEAVVPHVTYKPSAAVLKQLMAANSDYRRAIEASGRIVDKNWYVRLKPRG